MTKFRWTSWAIVVVCCGCRASSVARVSDRTQPIVARGSAEVAEHVAQRKLPDLEPSAEIELAAAQVIEEGYGVPPAPQTETGLSLSETISLGLANNPDLITFRQSENVGSAALGVAQTYPFNPFIQVQATPFQDQHAAGPGTTYHYVLLMQTIQLANQQQFREDGGLSTLNSTRWNIHQAELINVAQTERLYFNLLYLRGILDLTNASDQNNQQLLKTLETQLNAGQATAADVAIVRVDARSTKQQVRLAKASYETALRDLKRQLAITPDDPIRFAGDLRKLDWKLCSVQQMASSITSDDVTFDSSQRISQITSRAASRPDVLAAQSDIDVARAAMCLATAAKTPDVQVGPYYQRTADGTSFLGFRAQMDLPVINSGRPLEQQRIAEFNQRVTAWHQLQRRAELEAQAAWERYELAVTALIEDSADGDTDLPKELESLEQQFLQGEVDVVRVVQARNSIIQNQRVRLDLLNEVAQSAANLTAAAALPLEELLSVHE